MGERPGCFGRPGRFMLRLSRLPIHTVSLTPAQQSIVDHIVRLVRPLRVVVFGSVARGEARPDSDLDLLVVMPDGAPRRATAQKLYVEVPCRGIPFDVVVTTPERLRAYHPGSGFIYSAALREGVEVYVA